MSTRDSDRSIIDKARHAKRRVGRELNKISVTDLLGGVAGTATKLDRSVGNIPYYATVEQYIGEILDSKSTEEIRKELTTLMKGLVLSLVTLKTGKAPNGRELKRFGRGMNYVNISLGSVLLLVNLIELRRRRDATFPNPYYVPIEEVVSGAFDRYNTR